jgi:imidazole glycerol-phosphate synthase subunit HisH
MRRVTIFDYGAGNLHSLAKALAGPGLEVCIEPDPARAVETDVLVLPGVGSFAQAAGRLVSGRDVMRNALLHDALPTLGVCLGMQLLFDESEEGPGQGLGIIPGCVTRLAARCVPQIGWNTLEDVHDSIFDAAPMTIAYYANSFVCRPATDDTVIAWSRHEDDRFAAAVRAGEGGNIVGVQFHPEKSSGAGVRLIKAFLAEARRGPRVAGRGLASQVSRPAPRTSHPTIPELP